MSHSSNWPIPVTGYDSLRIMTKRLDRQARNASPIAASDLLGPGMSSQAIHILDWNDEVATFNGFFYTTAGGLNSPVVQDDEGEDVTDLPWIGTAIAREDGTGTHQVWNTDDPSSMYFRVRNWAPNPTDPDAPPIYGEWQRFATRSGFIAEEDLHPDVRDDIDTALSDAEEALGLIIPPNYVFRQDDEPVSTDDHELQNYDIWFDTNDDNRMWVYFDGAWADPTVEILTGASASAAAAMQNALAAAASAEEAITLANGKNTTYRQTTAPTGGTYVVGDTWEDTDDGNKPYRWDGSDWVLSITAWLQTTATASRGVKVTTAGIVAYADGTGSQPAGTATFTVNGATGDVAVIGNLAVGSTITGATITGTLQTTTTANRGVKITSTGIVFYDTGGSSVLTFSSSTGILSVTGPIVSGANISGSSITASSGGVIQSESTASRGVKINSSGLVSYSDGSNGVTAGVATFVLDGTTGAITLRGAITSSAIITGGTFQTASSGSARVVISDTFGGLIRFYNSGGTFGYVASSSSDVSIAGASGGLLSVGPSGVLVASGPLHTNTLGAYTGSVVEVTSDFDLNGNDVTGIATLSAFVVSTVAVTASGSVTASGDVHGTNVYVDGVPTTGNAANTYMGGVGRLFQSTSSRRYKYDIVDADLDVEAFLRARVTEHRRYDDPDYDAENPHTTGRVYVSAIAEELDDLGLRSIVVYDDQGRPNDIDGRVWDMHLLAALQHLTNRIELLEAS